MRFVGLLAIAATTTLLAACSDMGAPEEVAEATENGCTKIPDRPVRRAKLVMLEGECPGGYEKLAPGETERLAQEAREAKLREEARLAEARHAALRRAQADAELHATLEAMSVGAERAAAEAIARHHNLPKPGMAITDAAERDACLDSRDKAFAEAACRALLGRRQFTANDIRISAVRVYANKGTRVICGAYRYINVPNYDGSLEHEFVVVGSSVRERYRSGALIMSDCRNEQSSGEGVAPSAGGVTTTAASVPAQFYGNGLRPLGSAVTLSCGMAGRSSTECPAKRQSAFIGGVLTDSKPARPSLRPRLRRRAITHSKPKPAPWKITGPKSSLSEWWVAEWF